MENGTQGQNVAFKDSLRDTLPSTRSYFSLIHYTLNQKTDVHEVKAFLVQSLLKVLPLNTEVLELKLSHTRSLLLFVLSSLIHQKESITLHCGEVGSYWNNYRDGRSQFW